MNLVWTTQARDSLVEIEKWNVGRYGHRHAASYTNFLIGEIESLAQGPSKGRPVDDYPSLRRYLIKRRTHGQGHVAIYRVKEETVEILFLYHTSQDWSRRLAEDFSE